ncbi:glycosyltransferase family 4 protein [Abditibacterium utsteinense]|nr:glycosyltransferase family 4 protein [Abditibacterium utsteinense]
MKIAIFASAFHPSLGGVEELVRQLAHAFKRAGHEAIIVTERWPRDLPASESYDGIQVYRFPFRILSGGSLANRAKSAVSLVATGKAIQRQIVALLAREKIDIVNIQCVSANALYARNAARQLRLPLVVTLQGELTMDATGLYQKSEAARNRMRGVLESAAAITGCSKQTLDEAEAFFARPFGPRGHLIYNGIRLADFDNAAAYAHPRPYILGIGRHVAQKGFDILLRAYAQMKSEVSPAELPDLLLAGDGEVHQELRQLSRELKLEDRVHFVGRADRAQAVALFKGCEFFVLPSRHEPMGIVNLEAMAAGKAVIASNVGGVSELVSQGETGILVPGADVTALSQALALLCRDTELRERLAKAGAVRAQQFDWEILTEQYLEIYRQFGTPHSFNDGQKTTTTSEEIGAA